MTDGQPYIRRIRAYVLTTEEFALYGKTVKEGLILRQEIKDKCKTENNHGVDVYSPDEVLLFRITW